MQWGGCGSLLKFLPLKVLDVCFGLWIQITVILYQRTDGSFVKMKYCFLVRKVAISKFQMSCWKSIFDHSILLLQNSFYWFRSYLDVWATHVLTIRDKFPTFSVIDPRMKSILHQAHSQKRIPFPIPFLLTSKVQELICFGEIPMTFLPECEDSKSQMQLLSCVRFIGAVSSFKELTR